MNKVKNLIENFISIDADNIDPFNLICDFGPWIVGSYALQKFTNSNWEANDIDYVVKDKFQYEFVFKFFKKICLEHEVTKQGTDTFYLQNNLKVQILPAKYKDIRLRLDKHDISICQIGHNGKQFIMSKKCQQHINDKVFTIDPVYGISVSLYQTEQRILKYTERGYEQN